MVAEKLAVNCMNAVKIGIIDAQYYTTLAACFEATLSRQQLGH
jgi:hypothetical protein